MGQETGRCYDRPMPWPNALISRMPRESRMLVSRWVRSVLGVLWGAALCIPLLIAAALPPSSRPVGKVRGWEVSRQLSTFGIAVNPPPATRRFLALNGVVAALVTVPVLNFLAGFVTVFVGAVVQGLSLGGSITIGFDSWRIAQPTLFVGLLYAAANLIGAIALSEAANWLHGRIDGMDAEVSRPNARYSRITELVMTRRGVVVAIDDERRRIERDLHDGVQQNVVSLSMLIARARRAQDPDKAARLLDDALAQSQDLIEETREVAWRVYPTALDDHGLPPVLNRIADRCPIPITVVAAPEQRLPSEVESAVYFVVREAVTNVVKHAQAAGISISIRDDDGVVVTEVVDDGDGGADQSGSGLQGLARRVGALDGRLVVDSPAGTGTTVRAEIPHG
jgi:signal transduction histidine kinase